jgi:hypothetical protein
MNIKHAYLIAFAITVGIITWGDIKECHEMPWPPRIVAAGLAFGMLDIFSIVSEELSGVIAIGIVLAAIVNKGFTANCQHAEATAQPASYTTLQGGQTPTALA